VRKSHVIYTLITWDLRTVSPSEQFFWREHEFRGINGVR
jgi:hypothetical protein